MPYYNKQAIICCHMKLVEVVWHIGFKDLSSYIHDPYGDFDVNGVVFVRLHRFGKAPSYL